MGNLIVVDDEYTALATEINNYGKALEDIITGYCGVLDEALQIAVIKGDAASALKQFNSMASQLKGCISGICAAVSGDCNSYVADVDGVDDFLF